jgi:hypothetical protein
VPKKEPGRRGATLAPEVVARLVASCVDEVEREFVRRGDASAVRSEVILRLRDRHACTWAQIGNALGITGERARQLHRQETRARARDEFARAFLVRGPDVPPTPENE